MDNAHTAVTQADIEQVASALRHIADMTPDEQPRYPNGLRPFGTQEMRYIADAVQSTADLQDRLDACEAALADAYYVLTYVQGLSDDDETEAACQEVRDKIDALATTRNADAKGSGA